MAEKISISGEKVVVAAKLPHGLIMRIFDKREVPEVGSGGPNGVRIVAQSLPRPETVTIKGYLQPYSGNQPPPLSQTSRWAFTENLDREFVERWFKENQDQDMVTNHLIFFASSMTAAQGKARELEALRTGLEPMDPAKLPVRGVETAVVK